MKQNIHERVFMVSEYVKLLISNRWFQVIEMRRKE